MKHRRSLTLSLFSVVVLVGCTDGRETDQNDVQTATGDVPSAPTTSPAPVPSAARGMAAGMPMDGSQGATSTEQHTTTGTVTAIDAAQRKITLAHEAVPSLQWPPMTMSFRVEDGAMIDALQVGDQVRFSFTQQGDAFVIGDISKS
jgi:Cu(I)/Ag(I) efflux system protein CusF